MTITILKQTAGQKIPRPFNRARSEAEMVELLAYHVAATTGPALGRIQRAKEAAARAVNDPAAAAHIYILNLKNINTDEPIVVLGAAKFYAFTEE